MVDDIETAIDRFDVQSKSANIPARSSPRNLRQVSSALIARLEFDSGRLVRSDLACEVDE
jgi:hypothetical protein